MKNASYFFVWNILGFRITVYFWLHYVTMGALLLLRGTFLVLELLFFLFVTFCYYGSFCFCSIGKEHSL